MNENEKILQNLIMKLCAFQISIIITEKYFFFFLIIKYLINQQKYYKEISQIDLKNIK